MRVRRCVRGALQVDAGRDAIDVDVLQIDARDVY
jgi:hypothetical protein